MSFAQERTYTLFRKKKKNLIKFKQLRQKNKVPRSNLNRETSFAEKCEMFAGKQVRAKPAVRALRHTTNSPPATFISVLAANWFVCCHLLGIIALARFHTQIEAANWKCVDHKRRWHLWAFVLTTPQTFCLPLCNWIREPAKVALYVLMKKLADGIRYANICCKWSPFFQVSILPVSILSWGFFVVTGKRGKIGKVCIWSTLLLINVIAK